MQNDKVKKTVTKSTDAVALSADRGDKTKLTQLVHKVVTQQAPGNKGRHGKRKNDGPENDGTTFEVTIAGKYATTQDQTNEIFFEPFPQRD